ncbi:MAG: peptidoglycan DD-metalloendopeptidase family protein [Arsenophonus sp.]|nr:MAG: peptidoglycan DD-metalloendopeptidase family protein [Arsenophonus sp.]
MQKIVKNIFQTYINLNKKYKFFLRKILILSFIFYFFQIISQISNLRKLKEFFVNYFYKNSDINFYLYKKYKEIESFLYLLQYKKKNDDISFHSFKNNKRIFNNIFNINQRIINNKYYLDFNLNELYISNINNKKRYFYSNEEISRLINQYFYMYSDITYKYVDFIIVKKNFINDLINTDLNIYEINQIIKIISYQININKIKSGDQISFLIYKKVFNRKSKIFAIYCIISQKKYFILLKSNNEYIDINENHLNFDFLNFPSKKRFRISSYFNLNRLHPITKKVSPHFGVDLSMPIGTPVISIGDGKIVSAKYDKIAGNFITISHNINYISRYLHLQKIFVHNGQIVKKGECIALSGNSGRTTGPHLHYEFWINNKPVDPLKLEILIPRLNKYEYEEFHNFLKKIRSKLSLIENFYIFER